MIIIGVAKGAIASLRVAARGVSTVALCPPVGWGCMVTTLRADISKIKPPANLSASKETPHFPNTFFPIKAINRHNTVEISAACNAVLR